MSGFVHRSKQLFYEIIKAFYVAFKKGCQVSDILDDMRWIEVISYKYNNTILEFRDLQIHNLFNVRGEGSLAKNEGSLATPFYIRKNENVYVITKIITPQIIKKI